MPQFLFVATIPLLALLLAPALALSARPPAPDGPMLALIPPWQAPEAVVARAGGVLLPLPSAPLTVTVAGTGPDLADRLRAAGAWAILPADARGLFCGAPE